MIIHFCQLFLIIIGITACTNEIINQNIFGYSLSIIIFVFIFILILYIAAICYIFIIKDDISNFKIKKNK